MFYFVLIVTAMQILWHPCFVIKFKGLFGTEGCKTLEQEKTQEWERNRGVKQRIGKYRNFVETSVWNTGILIA